MDEGDTAERRLFYKNRGCCYATIISHLPVLTGKTNEGGKDDDNNNEKEGGTKRTVA